MIKGNAPMSSRPTATTSEGPRGAPTRAGPSCRVSSHLISGGARASRIPPGRIEGSGARGRLAVRLVAGGPVGGEARPGAEPLHPLLVLPPHRPGLGLALIADVVAVGGEERGERRGDATVERQDVVGGLRL